MGNKKLILPKVPNKNEVLELFSKAKNIRNKMLLETIYYMGLRVSEAINIKYEDIDLSEGGFITIRQGKGGRDRLIPIPKTFYNDLNMWLKLQKFNSEDKLFPISRVQVHNIIKSINPEIHAHSLRHAYGTFLYEKTGDLRAVQEMLGHKNLETSRIYTHLSKEFKRKIIDKAFE